MTAIVSKHGELLFIIQADEQTIELNTFDDCIATEDPPASNMYYENGWVNMPDQPSQNHIFNYETRQWFDPRGVEQIKEQKWSEIKSQRDLLEFGGFEFEGNIYDSDRVSQGRIMGAALAEVDQVWTLADNRTITLSSSKLLELYKALQQHVATAHERGRIARQAIEAATSKEELDLITL